MPTLFLLYSNISFEIARSKMANLQAAVKATAYIVIGSSALPP